MPSASPAVISIPTLGHAARLGELYDHRSGGFLGVQLYPQEKVKEVTTDVKNTDLSLSISTTRDSKATLLDISAKLSLSILSGLVKVSGSAHYVNDEKSNSTSYAYALALKMRLNEKRILFAEEYLGTNVLPVAEEDYINTKMATHFVSAVTYGGNYIVNLVARKSELSKEKDIEGKLHLEFDKLKGLVSLDGEASAKIKNSLSHLDDKFDLVIHGDVALDTVPVNPKDVLDTFPQAAKFIAKDGGVPISVTLQPIPPKLYKAGLIYTLDADFVDDVLAAFSKLGDVSSRFKVLQDGTDAVQRYVPELARTTRVVVAIFTREHSELRNALSDFLKNYQHGTKPAPGDASRSDQKKGDDDTVKDSDISRENVLKEIDTLYEKYLHPDLQINDKISEQYRPSLTALEDELARFQSFVSDVQKERKSPDSIPLSRLETVAEAIATQSTIPLFIMTPLTAGKVNPNLAIIRYRALLHNYTDDLNHPTNPAYLLYAEDLGKLDLQLGPPGGKIFSVLKVPTVVVGTVDGDGELNWAGAGPGADLTFPLSARSSLEYSIKGVSLSPPSLDSRKSFSFRVDAVASLVHSDHFPFLHLRDLGTNRRFLRLLAHPISVELGNLDNGPGRTTTLDGNWDCSLGKTFAVTFVQDVQARKWILYFDDRELVNAPFNDGVLEGCGLLYFSFQRSDIWWDGQISNLKVFPRALTQEEVKAEA